MKQEAYIELMEYNTIMSLLDFLQIETEEYKVNNKSIQIVPAFSDIKIPYKTPSISIDILYRKNRSIGFGSFYGDQEIVDEQGIRIVEIEGTIFEYRIQMNVYSNTRGENYKWCSILDGVLKNGEKRLPINTYNDKGEIKQSNVGNLSYDFSNDITTNSMDPNIESYDFHTIYEIKSKALQKYTVTYDIMEIGNIIGKLK